MRAGDVAMGAAGVCSPMSGIVGATRLGATYIHLSPSMERVPVFLAMIQPLIREPLCAEHRGCV